MKWNTKNTDLAAQINKGNRYTNGNTLNATSLNAIVDELINLSDINLELLGDAFNPKKMEDLYIDWVRNANVFKEETIRLRYGKFPFYGVITSWDNDLVEATDISDDNSLGVRLRETQKLHDLPQGPMTLYFFRLSIYSVIGNMKSLVATKEIHIHYFNEPAGPND